MRIRQPLSRSWRVGLGVSAMVVLVLTYGWLAHRRQVQKRALATEQWQRVARQITELDSRLAAANDPEEMTQLKSQRDNLVEAAARLRQESENGGRSNGTDLAQSVSRRGPACFATARSEPQRVLVVGGRSQLPSAGCVADCHWASRCRS